MQVEAPRRVHRGDPQVHGDGDADKALPKLWQRCCIPKIASTPTIAIEPPKITLDSKSISKYSVQFGSGLGVGFGVTAAQQAGTEMLTLQQFVPVPNLPFPVSRPAW